MWNRQWSYACTFGVWYGGTLLIGMALTKHLQQIIRNPHMITADMDGETVMMGVAQGAYFGLGGIGSRVWELLAQPMTMAQLVEAVCAEYAVDEATCRADVQQFLDALAAQGLVQAA